ncbi:adenosylcobalamin-dependent ribonucleoside-diphosphate reductase [Aquibaculum arenosum]|uniref:Vitamin B12-dependent ribonucleotide reductase n=1 Tax=Aquibaculum arenosum TaxID=3032591 RepID=A0ABT5YJV9_9PROT|nr:adenosylcobalamin-dependent ribonucleoside-diphosphate reductase [Fodinicurvata sp. CAU 1616]MDF2095224.1 adenosylcobalamin-dependent ribonucleoside-diphosphate reductase [Fodinicurvata sp. CAU 1616]
MTELSAFSRQIWEAKYRYAGPLDSPPEAEIDATWDRVAQALAAVESEPERWRPRFRDALQDFRFMPAGRILSGAGTDRTVTLFNCFVMGAIPDDLGGIFAHLREAALTLQHGGGIGYDFSTLRPKGALVKSLGAPSSGPVSFMQVWDAMCETIMSAGARRGAMMATLRCDHPDVEEFVDAKRVPGRLTNFNLSVLVTDAFMRAVRADEDWSLHFNGQVFRSVKARRLWERILRATYETAEPGVIFIDRVNRLNNLAYCETIQATNPCGEQPLPPYGACLLGSINLAALVRDAFTAKARLDEAALEDLVRVAVRMLDNAIDASRFPLEAQRREARAKRRIGLGITGLADALIYCGLRYGSREAVDWVEGWMAALRRAAYLASTELAAEKGVFPLFDREAFLAGEATQGLEPEIRVAIAEKGLRNGLLTSVAPTGTISLLADNLSSGLEPVFAFSYRRQVREPDGSRRSELVSDPAWRAYRERFGAAAPLSPAFVEAKDLSPEDHLVMQAAVQKYVDAGVSKTINLPAEIPFESFRRVYDQAWDLGCKGCTTYRPSPLRGAVLEAGADRPAAQPEAEPPTAEPLARPETLPGRTYKLTWPESDHALYVTINDVVREGRRRPFEIFINSKNMEHYAWTVVLTRMISAVFRRGGAVGFVVEELKAVFDPRGGAWMDGRYVPSLLAAIGGVIERHMIDTGFLPADAEGKLVAGEGVASNGDAIAPALRQCPKCGSLALLRQEGCDLCTACSYSRCA